MLGANGRSAAAARARASAGVAPLAAAATPPPLLLPSSLSAAADHHHHHHHRSRPGMIIGPGRLRCGSGGRVGRLAPRLPPLRAAANGGGDNAGPPKYPGPGLAWRRRAVPDPGSGGSSSSSGSGGGGSGGTRSVVDAPPSPASGADRPPVSVGAPAAAAAAAAQAAAPAPRPSDADGADAPPPPQTGLPPDEYDLLWAARALAAATDAERAAPPPPPPPSPPPPAAAVPASLALVVEEARELEADLSAVITTAAQELGLGNEATQQLTDVLHKLEQLEQDLSAAIITTSASPTPPADGAAAAAAAAEPAAAAAAAAPADTTPAASSEALAAAAAAAAAAPAAAAPAPAGAYDSAKLWALFALGLAYVHQATTGFALPAMLPMISPALGLSDFQGAMLTSGYSYLYALALVPVGLLADRVPRPQLLAVGVALWSLLSAAASRAGSFSDLLLARVGFAAAQATQNPVAFSLIPDLFPNNKSTALAAYNCAIYLGRALSFAAVLAAHRLGDRGGAAAVATASAPEPGVALSMVPLDKLDLQRMSIIYTAGDMAAVTPVYNYNFHVIAYESAGGGALEGWRSLLFWLGVPGAAIAALLFTTVREPRGAGGAGGGARGAVAALTERLGWGDQKRAAIDVDAASSSSTSNGADNGSSIASDGSTSSSTSSSTAGLFGSNDGGVGAAAVPALAAAGAAPAGAAGGALALPLLPQQQPQPQSGVAGAFAPVRQLLGVRAFQATTLAAALNDLGSYALIAWHSTFYERVFGLDSSVYAPMLAVILPVGGIVGGVGGGLLADALSAVGGRYWLTCGASLVAAPFIAASLLSDSTADSFLALLVGFAMSEAWRAPSAIMIRTIAPQELGSTASALYLCIRNLVGGAGPVLVAKLAEAFGLQRAMLLTPACYVVSGLLFLAAERAIDEQRRAEQQQQQQLAAAAAAAAAAGAIDVQAVAVTGEGGDGDGHGGGVAAPVAGGKVASTPSDHGSSGSS